MLSEGNSDLISSVERSYIKGQYMELLVLFDGRVIALSSSAIALYRDTASVADELGNGLIQLCEIPQLHALDKQSTPWVSQCTAGFVGLHNGMALLILPKDVRLYCDNSSALRNENPILAMPLT